MKVCIEATYIRVSMKALLGYVAMKASFVQIKPTWLQQVKLSAIFVRRLSPSAVYFIQMKQQYFTHNYTY